VALVATGGLTAAYAVTLVGATNAYLAVTRTVPAGSQLTSADLTVVQISTDPALRAVPAARRGDVIGKYAAVELFPGALLADGQVVDVPLGGPGTYLVSIGVSQDRLPVQRIKAGVTVVLIVLPKDGLGLGAEQEGEPQTFSATVVDVAEGTQPGRYFVNVALSEGDGPRVAMLAAANRITITRAGG
jgi:hypothetical protein